MKLFFACQTCVYFVKGRKNICVRSRCSEADDDIDQKRQNIPADRGLPYGGCWVNVSIDVSCYTKSGGGVTAYLNGVQLVKEDAPLGAGATAGSCRNDFDEIETPSADPFALGKDDKAEDDIF